jgi:hypothetical protein
MNKSHVRMQNSKCFILEYKYAQTHRKTLIFSMTMELSYLKLDIHTHRMLELRKFVKLL